MASTSNLAPPPAKSEPEPSEPRPKRTRIKSNPEVALSNAASPSRGARAKPVVKSEAVKVENNADVPLEAQPAVAKRRRTKKEADEQEEIFPPRPSPHLPDADSTHKHPDRRGSGLFIGAHISSAGGVENAPLNALRIGGNAFSCFVRPKMQWASNPIPDTSAESFRQRVAQHRYMPPSTSDVNKEDHDALSEGGDYGYVVPHGCYLVNLANPDEGKREKSFEAFIDDLRRCEQLGIKLFNFHPGSMTAASASADADLESKTLPRSGVRTAKADACALVASYINRAHSLTSSVIILVENMAGSKADTILGSSLHDLAAILSHVADKSRVGICLDTCHAFAAGYDLTTPRAYAAFAAEIEATVGWETVRAFHLNDSKFALGCRRDRHANIGRGHIGLGGFWNVVNDDRWNGTPLVLETPALGNAAAAYPAKEATKKMHEVWSYQIQALYALRGTAWGKWDEAEEWLAKADTVVAEAERLSASKKGSKPSAASKAKPKKRAPSDDDESELSSDD